MWHRLRRKLWSRNRNPSVSVRYPVLSCNNKRHSDTFVFNPSSVGNIHDLGVNSEAGVARVEHSIEFNSQFVSSSTWSANKYHSHFLSHSTFLKVIFFTFLNFVYFYHFPSSVAGISILISSPSLQITLELSYAFPSQIQEKIFHYSKNIRGSPYSRGVSRVWQAGHVPWAPLAGGFWFVWVSTFRIDTFLLILTYVYISVY
jgi:hypothetical protein